MCSESHSLSCPHAGIGRHWRLEEIGTPQLERNMVLPSPARCAVCRGINAREAMEIPREVGLVGVSASDSQLRPSHIAPLVQCPHGALKPSHPAPLFGRKANILAEDMVQAPCADAQRARRFTNAQRSKQTQCPANVASPFPSRSPLTKHLVQNLQGNFRRGLQSRASDPASLPSAKGRKGTETVQRRCQRVRATRDRARQDETPPPQSSSYPGSQPVPLKSAHRPAMPVRPAHLHQDGNPSDDPLRVR